MNLKKLSYFYLPAIAIGFAFAALIFDFIAHVPVRPIIYVIIIFMALIIYLGFRSGVHKE